LQFCTLDSEGGSGDPIIEAYGGRSLHEQSPGESFLALMNHRFRGQGLYILDEPEAALSPNRQLGILRRKRELVLQESQFIIATHSPILLAYPNAKILLLDQNGYKPMRYEDTEHYQLARRFLNDPEEALKAVFAESGNLFRGFVALGSAARHPGMSGFRKGPPPDADLRYFPKSPVFRP
jgi:predicted ATPase